MFRASAVVSAASPGLNAAPCRPGATRKPPHTWLFCRAPPLPASAPHSPQTPRHLWSGGVQCNRSFFHLCPTKNVILTCKANPGAEFIREDATDSGLRIGRKQGSSSKLCTRPRLCRGLRGGRGPCSFLSFFSLLPERARVETRVPCGSPVSSLHICGLRFGLPRPTYPF